MTMVAADARPKTADELGPVVDELLAEHNRDRRRLDTIAAYLANRVDAIYVPSKATTEYRQLVDQARFNVLPRVEKAVAQNLFVDGFRPSAPGGRVLSADNSPVWDAVWQPNRMDARQAGLWRPAIRYGYSYATVLPGSRVRRPGAEPEPVPVITPYSPRMLTACYADPSDEWPHAAMVAKMPVYKGAEPGSDPLASLSIEQGCELTVFDEWFRYQVRTMPGGGFVTTGEAEWHGLGVVPVVRFLDEQGCDGLPQGKIWPLLPAQRQLNQITFDLLMCMQYAAFHQKWVTGMVLQEDANGVPIEPFNPRVDGVLQAEDPAVKFGQFAATDPAGYLSARDKTLQFISATASIPPHHIVLGDGISNLSAEALAALINAHQRDIAEHQSSFADSVEQMIRLSGLAMGTPEGLEAWFDTSAEVVWRDTEPRSLPATIDALGKAAQMLEIPVEVLWELWPGQTDARLARWLAARDAGQQASRIREMLMTELQPPDPAGDGDDPKSKADALGALIRAGVAPESAAARVGLSGLEFTGAVPVSLRLPESEAADLEAG